MSGNKQILYIARNIALSEFHSPLILADIHPSPTLLFLHHSHGNGLSSHFKGLLEFSTDKIPTVLLAGLSPKVDSKLSEPHLSVVLGIEQDDLKQIEKNIHVLTAKITSHGEQLTYPSQCLKEYLENPNGLPIGLWSNIVNNEDDLTFLANHMAVFEVSNGLDRKRMGAQCLFAGSDILNILPRQLAEEGNWHTFELLDTYARRNGGKEGCVDSNFLMSKMSRV
jgi:hypothetical protein